MCIRDSDKTVHVIFPAEVRDVDLGSPDLIAGKADGAENIIRVKATVRNFPNETIEEAKMTATKEAKRIIVASIQRVATETAIENAVYSNERKMRRISSPTNPNSSAW